MCEKSGLWTRGRLDKALVRRLIRPHVPETLFERPKAGFGIPWLRGPLREWAEDLLAPQRLAADGWFDATVIRHRWDDHLAGTADSAKAMWTILMCQARLHNQAPPATNAIETGQAVVSARSQVKKLC